jgi:hypothetical protein
MPRAQPAPKNFPLPDLIIAAAPAEERDYRDS